MGDGLGTWNSSGLLDHILQRLQATFVDAGLIDTRVWHVDGTIVRAARCAGGGGKKGIHGNRKTMPLVAPEAVFPRRSI